MRGFSNTGISGFRRVLGLIGHFGPKVLEFRARITPLQLAVGDVTLTSTQPLGADEGSQRVTSRHRKDAAYPRPATPPHGPRPKGGSKRGPRTKPYADPGQDPQRNPDGIIDIFAGTPWEYNINERYVRSTNGHDHSSQVRVSFPPTMIGCVREVMEVVPEYRTVEDFIRDAVVHRLQFFFDTPMNEWQNVEWFEFQKAAARFDVSDQRRREQVELLDAQRVALEELAMDGQWATVVARCDQLELVVNEMEHHHQTKGHTMLKVFRDRAQAAGYQIS